MLRLLAKALRGRRLRMWLATAGVAVCTLLVTVVASTARSVKSAISDYAGQPGVDLWVAPAEADNLIRGSFLSFVPVKALDSIRAIPGVAAADPIQEAFLQVQRPGETDPRRRLTLLTIGHVRPAGLGGPPVVREGQAPTALGEVALDRAAAYRLGVGVDDTIEVGGVLVVVSGLTSGTNIMATQFLFTDFDIVAIGSRALGQAAFVLVRLEAGGDRDAVVAEIERQNPKLRAYTREYFAAANEREISAGFLPLLTLSTALALGTATLVVGLLVLSVVDERQADISVLLALGAGSRAVGAGVLTSAALMSLRGALSGVGLAYALSFALDAWLPTIPLRIGAADVLVITALFVATGAAAAVAPVVFLGRIDPLEAFRS